MEAVVGIAGLLFVGSITPGPNNFIVMREAARAGWRGAWRAIVGIVAGVLTLVAVVSLGAGALFAAEPRFATAITIGGGLYLAFLGARLMARGSGEDTANSQGQKDGLPVGTRGLFGFQFLNPKAWILVLTATSSAQGSLTAAARAPVLIALFTVIPIVCLTVWSFLGLAMTRSMSDDTVRRWVDRTMGILLIGFAILLLLGL